VSVHVTIEGAENALRDFEFGAETDSRGVSVQGHRSGGWWLDLSWLFESSMRVHYQIQVPREYQLDLRTAGGDIESKNLHGNVHAHTSGGDIHVSQLSGDAQMRTSGGVIEATDTVGQLDLRTSGGSIRLQNVEGKVSARTSGGNIDASLRSENRGATLRTSGGNIRIDVEKGFKATIDAHTSGGGVTCDAPLTSRESNDNRGERNNLNGDINGGGEILSVRTSGGNIRIHEGA
jgi:DUF4097 and DUF4098 domain-containing protein YvlB